MTVHVISEWFTVGDRTTTYTVEEHWVKLLLENSIVWHVNGLSASQLSMWNEIQGLMIEYGCPSFYLTINPADVYNPVLKYLSGEKFDLDNTVWLRKMCLDFGNNQLLLREILLLPSNFLIFICMP